MRIDRILAESGAGTRKDVGLMLRQGRVRLDGVQLKDPKQHISDEEAARLKVDGEAFIPRRHLHFLLNKPEGVLSAAQDKHAPAALDLLPAYTHTRKLVPVGRLDKDSSGLLFFTNDGQLNHRLTSPKHRIGKRYRVSVELLDSEHNTRTRGISMEDVDLFRSGQLELDGKPLLPSELIILNEWEAEAVLYEGRFRQLRRMFELVGLKVVQLKRIAEGSLLLGGLPLGAARPLTDREISELYLHAGLADPDAYWRELAPAPETSSSLNIIPPS